MINERKAKLQATMKQFNKEQKSEIFTLGNEIKVLDVIPSGVKGFDDFIGGGFKQGGHTIIYGNYSVGKTALILQTIANAQKLGKLVCYVNTEKPIEPERFIFFGVNLDELIYIEAPDNAELALEAMRRLCTDKVIDLFIIDSTNGLCPKSSIMDMKTGKERELEKKDVTALPGVLSSFYNKVNPLVFKSRASVIWIGQTRTKGIGSYFVHDGLTGGNAQNFYAYQIINLRNGQKANEPVQKFKEYYCDPDGKVRYSTVSEPVGFAVVAKLDKTNSCKSGKQKTEIDLAYYFDSGFTKPLAQIEEQLRITGTEEEKAKIKAYLIDKGVIASETPVESKIAEQNPSTNEVEETIEEVVETKEKVAIKGKKRGRKPKKT